MASCREHERPCANCQSNSNLTCKACEMVLYCGAECQKAHWPKHRLDCKSPLLKRNWKPNWILEARRPAVVKSSNTKVFWRNVPAYDILNLPANEGVDYGKELLLLFAASGDPGNVVKTLTSVPAGYKKSVDLVINDKDFAIAARNIMFVLTALVVKDDKAAIECMVHLWYSSLIRPSDFSLLTTEVRPLIENVVRKIANKPESQVLGNTWTIGPTKFRVELPKRLWDHLLAYFSVPADLSAEQAKNVRKDVTLAPEQVEGREYEALLKMPAHRLASMKFFEDGILLPFGASRADFSVPNPTFFRSAAWLMSGFWEPVLGWHFPEILEVDSGAASKDVYGKLYYHLLDLLLAFRDRLSTQSCNFHMLNMDPTELPAHLSGMDFARVETSNIADRAWLGTESTVSLFRPLLQRPDDNPCATLITCYINAVEEAREEDGTPPDGEISKLRDYMTLGRFSDIAAVHGMAIKDRNTIIEKWPLQLKKKPGQPGAQEEFELLRSSGHGGSERYVEWKRA